MNNDKTKLTIIHKGSMETFFKNFSFKAGNDIIKNKNSIKILGTIIQNDLKLDKSMNKLCSQLHNRIFNIRKLTKYTDFKTRSKFLNGFVMGKINYMVPLYSTATKVNLNKLHMIITTAARAAIGDYCFRKSVKYILDKCKWFDIYDLIKYSSLNIIHKTITTGKPPGLIGYFRNNNNQRSVKLLTTKYKPKTKKFLSFYIYKYFEIYNNLDTYIKLKSTNGFKQEIKLMLRAGTIPDTMD